MKDDMIIDKIKKSAEHVEIPDKLIPSNMKTRWEEENNKIRRFPRRFYTVLAAACLIIIFLGVYTGIYKNIGRNAGEPDSQKQYVINDTNSALADEITTESTEMETPEESKDSEEAVYALKGVRSADNYDEIYTALQKIEYECDVVMEDEDAVDGAESKNISPSTQESYSQTNIREEGVDEGDIVKTDGKYIYKVINKRIISIIKIDDGEMEEIGRIELDKANNLDQIYEFYVDENTLSILAEGYQTSLTETEDSLYGVLSSGYVYCYTYDITNPSQPEFKGKVCQEGYYQSSRKTGDYIYLFSYYNPDLQTQLKSSYIPQVNDDILRADDIYIPNDEFIQNTSYLVITSLNINDPGEIVESKAVISAGYMFYVSTGNIYIVNYSGNNQSQIIKIMYDEGVISPVAADMVSGMIDDSFSIDEYQNYVRILTTDYSGNTVTNSLYILDEGMNTVGQIRDIAPNETIKSARFMGETAYFVTFRQIDPLFSVDISDPENPKIQGELKITGFSEYLHLYTEDKLLGIGWEVNPNTNETIGLKLSMFDITDPSDVKEISKYIIKSVDYAEILDNYKSIMIDTKKNLFGFSVSDENQKYYVFTYDENEGFKVKYTYNSENHSNGLDYSIFYMPRGIYVSDIFYLVTDRFIESYNMEENFAVIDLFE